MTPDEIRAALAQHFPELIAEPRTSPAGWSFFLGQVRRGPEPTRIFHANRSSPGARTMMRLPVSKRVLRDSEYYQEFAGGVSELLALVRRELQLYRCVLGDRHRDLPFPSARRTDNVVAIARQMYGSRDFSAMPILADALQDAGCDSPDILMHCRAEGAAHACGCWVVDLVLATRTAEIEI